MVVCDCVCIGAFSVVMFACHTFSLYTVPEQSTVKIPQNNEYNQRMCDSVMALVIMDFLIFDESIALFL